MGSFIWSRKVCDALYFDILFHLFNWTCIMDCCFIFLTVYADRKKFAIIQRDDLSGMQMSGNKVRKLEFLMADAVAQGSDCIITIGGIQSNHCRATAVAAKYLNLDCYLILRTSKVNCFLSSFLNHCFGLDFASFCRQLFATSFFFFLICCRFLQTKIPD